MNLLVNDKKIIKKYNEILDKIKSLSKRGFDKKKHCITVNILVLKWKSIMILYIPSLNIKNY